MSFIPIDDPLFTTVGDAAHYVCLASALVFAVLVARLATDDSDTFFDSEWKKEGFCVTNADVPYWTSHDACLYVDSVAAVLLAGLYLVLRKTPGLERANELFLPGCIGIFAHGIGHGTVSKVLRDDGDLLDLEDSQAIPWQAMQALPTSEVLQMQIPSVLFWLGLLKASAPNLSSLMIAALSLAAMGGQIFVPKYFQFTYVQTFLFLSFSINQLARNKKEKDFTYATYPLLVGVPVTLMGWMESTQCTAFVKDKLYGHLVYDGFIPFGLLTWYIVAYLRVSLEDDGSSGTCTTSSQTLKQKKNL